MKRKPAVAGLFYPGNAADLKRMIGRMIDPRVAKVRAIAAVSPHAGYIYSGPVAGALFSSIEVPATVLVLGPSHRGIRPTAGIQRSGSWETPLGGVPIATDLADAIMSRSSLVEDDPAAHDEEHSIEVQIPFLQYLRSDLAFVPLILSHKAGEKDLLDLGKALAGAVAALGRDVLIVASTDMSHYVSREVAREKDGRAIDRVLALDAAGLLRTVVSEDISMCGFQPVAAAVAAAKSLGATRAEVVRYATSGDTTGDNREVVGYAGIRII
jgi:MEMO1 family protein